MKEDKDSKMVISFGTKRMELPFESMLTKPTSLALKPKSVFQRREEKNW